MTQPEKYLCIKQLTLALKTQYGLTRTEDYIRAIRSESISRGETIFVSGEGRVSEVFVWIKTNPRFRRRHVRKRMQPGFM